MTFEKRLNPGNRTKSGLCRLVLLPLVLAAAGQLAIATGAAAEIKIRSVKLKVGGPGRSVTPTIIVKYYRNISDWDATGLPVFFHLESEIKIRGGRLINQTVRIPRGGPNGGARLYSTVAGSVTKRWRYRSRSRRASHRLGINTANAIKLCRFQLRNGGGDQTFDMAITLDIHFTVYRRGDFKGFTRTRQIAGKVRCQGLTGPRGGTTPGATRNLPFKVTGASMQVTKLNRQCPRKVFVRVTLRGNKDGRARYAFMIGQRPPQARVMGMTWKGGKKYSASFAHQFMVRRSRVIAVWVRHKGKRISGIRRIRVNCARPWQPSGAVIQ